MMRGEHRAAACAAPTRRPYRSGTSELDVPRTNLKPRKFAAVLRYRKQQFRERWCLRPLEVSQTFVIVGRNYDDGWLAVLGDGLRLALCRFDDLAEPVFCVLNRPGGVRHERPHVARIYSVYYTHLTLPTTR